MKHKATFAAVLGSFVVVLIILKMSFLQPSQSKIAKLQGKSETLIRLGSDLRHFDPKKCPPGSIISQNISRMVPKHADCPTLFVVGTPKGGTTSMLEFVSMHPDFEGAELQRKDFSKGELNYFSMFYYKTAWEKYKKYFPTGVVTGESTSQYLADCNVPKRLFESCGRKAKVVMLLRNPVHRIISFYVMERMRSGTKLPLENFVRSELKKYPKWNIKNVTHEWNKVRCMTRGTTVIYSGFYYPQVMNWLCNFPAENLMIINSEEFYQRPSETVTEVLHFIGLSSLSKENSTAISTTVYNKGNYDMYVNDTKMSDKLLQQLHDLYKPFNEALFELLHWKKLDWSQ